MGKWTNSLRRAKWPLHSKHQITWQSALCDLVLSNKTETNVNTLLLTPNKWRMIILYHNISILLNIEWETAEGHTSHLSFTEDENFIKTQILWKLDKYEPLLDTHTIWKREDMIRQNRLHNTVWGWMSPPAILYNRL